MNLRLRDVLRILFAPTTPKPYNEVEAANERARIMHRRAQSAEARALDANHRATVLSLNVGRLTRERDELTARVASEQRTEKRATDDELNELYQAAYGVPEDDDETAPQARYYAACRGARAVAAHVRREQCLVTRLAEEGRYCEISPRPDGTVDVRVNGKAARVARASVRDTLERLAFGEVGA